jgi:signal transduction histidine kinase
LINSPFGFPITEGQFAELELLNKKGKPVIAEMLSAKMDWEGESAHLVSLRDISQKKKLEDELRKVEKLESMARLSGGIAHDFDNVLTAIIGNIQLAAGHSEPQSPIKTWLSRAEKACEKAESLSKQLFAFSKREKPVKQLVHFATLFRDNRWFKFENPHVELEFDIPSDAWEIEIEVEYVKEAFKYLFANAEEAMPSGGNIIINTENLLISGDEANNQLSFLKKGPYLKITVRDHGYGILDKNIPNIFDPYFTTKQGRIGLGLSIAYSIIKRHNGFITVQSEIANGSVFYIYLPANLNGTVKKNGRNNEG